jgi:hypothetical protein
MKKCYRDSSLLGLLGMGIMAAPVVAQAQYFNVPGNGGLLACFRKTGTHQGTNELVVYIGNVTNLIALPIGSSNILANVSGARLTDAFSSDFTYLQWSVVGANFNNSTVWSTPLGNFPQSTLWYTYARTNVGTQTSAPAPRLSSDAQGIVADDISSIGVGAQMISSQLATNVDNNTVLVVEPFQTQYSSDYLTYFMGDRYNGYGTSYGDLTGNEIEFDVENITPSPFSSVSRSDLYESAPAASTGRAPATYPDPISGSTTSVYFVGHFDLSPNGVLSFTRAAQAAAVPPAPTISCTVSGTTVKISFGTTNGATYGLIYTNLSGLTAPLHTWPTLGSPIIGNGGVTNFTDTITPNGRLYSVTAN